MCEKGSHIFSEPDEVAQARRGMKQRSFPYTCFHMAPELFLLIDAETKASLSMIKKFKRYEKLEPRRTIVEKMRT